MTYPEQERMRELLRAIYGRLSTSEEEEYDLDADELARIGAEMGLKPGQSVRLFRSLVDDGLVRLYSRAGDSAAWMEGDGGFVTALITDLSVRGKRWIGVLPPVDSIEGIVAALEDLQRRIEESDTLSAAAKREQTTTLQKLIDDVRAASVSIGIGELVKALAQGIPG